MSELASRRRELQRGSTNLTFRLAGVAPPGLAQQAPSPGKEQTGAAPNTKDTISPTGEQRFHRGEDGRASKRDRLGHDSSCSVLLNRKSDQRPQTRRAHA